MAEISSKYLRYAPGTIIFRLGKFGFWKSAFKVLCAEVHCHERFNTFSFFYALNSVFITINVLRAKKLPIFF